jgi:hypothetical protein
MAASLDRDAASVAGGALVRAWCEAGRRALTVDGEVPRRRGGYGEFSAPLRSPVGPGDPLTSYVFRHTIKLRHANAAYQGSLHDLNQERYDEEAST